MKQCDPRVGSGLFLQYTIFDAGFQIIARMMTL